MAVVCVILRLRGINLKKKITVIFFILAILLVSLGFGQVIGRIYLSSLTGKEDSQDSGYAVTIPENGVSKKVLRLNTFDYYTVLAGEYNQREPALLLGRLLSEKGLPAVITGGPSYRVLIAFASKAESMEHMASGIKIDGKAAAVVKGQVNSVAFKFQVGDKEAESLVAPLLGRISTGLNKGLLLYQGVGIGDVPAVLKPKFALLASELEKLGADGTACSGRLTNPAYQKAVSNLADWCGQWAASLYRLENDWGDSQFLKSQQQGLALLEEYHRFLLSTN